MGLEWPKKEIGLRYGVDPIFLKVSTGRIIEVKQQELFVGTIQPYKDENIKLLNPDKFKIFDFEATSHTIIVFFILLLLGHAYTFWLDFGLNNSRIKDYIRSIETYKFVLIALSVVTLWFLDKVLPRFIFWLINKLIVIKANRMFLKMKI